jgi:hypothetical protein
MSAASHVEILHVNPKGFSRVRLSDRMQTSSQTWAEVTLELVQRHMPIMSSYGKISQGCTLIGNQSHLPQIGSFHLKPWIFAESSNQPSPLRYGPQKMAFDEA